MATTSSEVPRTLFRDDVLAAQVDRPEPGLVVCEVGVTLATVAEPVGRGDAVVPVSLGHARAEREHQHDEDQGERGEGRTDPEEEVLHALKVSATTGSRLGVGRIPVTGLLGSSGGQVEERPQNAGPRP